MVGLRVAAHYLLYRYSPALPLHDCRCTPLTARRAMRRICLGGTTIPTITYLLGRRRM